MTIVPTSMSASIFQRSLPIGRMTSPHASEAGPSGRALLFVHPAEIDLAARPLDRFGPLEQARDGGTRAVPQRRRCEGRVARGRRRASADAALRFRPRPEISEPIPYPSLRAKRSNPGAAVRPSGLLAPRMPGPWIASSQGLLAMTDGAPLTRSIRLLSDVSSGLERRRERRGKGYRQLGVVPAAAERDNQGNSGGEAFRSRRQQQ